MARRCARTVNATLRNRGAWGTGALMTQSMSYPVGSRHDARIYAAFAVAAVIVIFTQKMALPLGGSTLMLSLPLILPIMAWLLIYAKARINLVRLGLFAAFAAALIIASLLTARPFSGPSILLALVLYFLWVVELPVSMATYRRCMNVLVWSAMVGAALVLVQQIAQAFGYHGWPNLETVLPKAIRQTGYNYLQPYRYLSPNIKPNGVFFLESSFVSQFVALGLIIELSLFRRIGRMALMAIALPLTYAGTGLIIVALCLPILLFRLSAKLAMLGIVAMIMVAGIAYTTGWVDAIAPRMTEVNQKGTSGYYRYTAPTLEAIERLKEPSALFTGDGAGGSTNDITDPTIYEPIIKVLLEYGILAALLYTALMLYCMFVSTPDKLIAWAFLLFFNTGGGYFIVPVNVLACLLGCILLRVERTRREAEQPIDRGLSYAAS